MHHIEKLNLGYIVTGQKHYKFIENYYPGLTDEIGTLSYKEFVEYALSLDPIIYQYIVGTTKAILDRVSKFAKDLSTRGYQVEFAQEIQNRLQTNWVRIDNLLENIRDSKINRDHKINKIIGTFSLLGTVLNKYGVYWDDYHRTKSVRKTIHNQIKKFSVESSDFILWEDLLYIHTDIGAYASYLEEIMGTISNLLNERDTPTFIDLESRTILAHPSLQLIELRDQGMSLKSYLCSEFGTFGEGYFHKISRGAIFAYDQELFNPNNPKSPIQKRFIERVYLPEGFVNKIITSFIPIFMRELDSKPISKRIPGRLINEVALDENNLHHLEMLKQKIKIVSPSGTSITRWIKVYRQEMLQDFIASVEEKGATVTLVDEFENQRYTFDNIVQLKKMDGHPMSETGFSYEISENSNRIVWAPYGIQKFANGEDLTSKDFSHLHIIIDLDSYEWYKNQQDRLRSDYKKLILLETKDGAFQDVTHFFMLVNRLFEKDAVMTFRNFTKDLNFSIENLNLFHAMEEIAQHINDFISNKGQSVCRYFYGYESVDQLVEFLEKFGFEFKNNGGVPSYSGFNHEFKKFFKNNSNSKIPGSTFHYYINEI